MTSIRNNEDRYLDAARGCILATGWKRTTLTDVARRAGVSRMTIYRTWPDMETLLADLMTREWGGVVAEQRAQLREHRPRQPDRGQRHGGDRRGLVDPEGQLDEPARGLGERPGGGRVTPAGGMHLEGHALHCDT